MVLVTSMAAAFVVSDEASAEPSASYSVTLDNYDVAKGSDVYATIKFAENDVEAFSSVSYTGKVVDGNGNSVTTLTSGSNGTADSGSSKGDYTWTVKFTAPSNPGDYKVVVTFTEKVTVDAETKTLDAVTAEAGLKVGEPITLSVTLKNNGKVDFVGDLYFYVDGQIIEASKQNVTVAVDAEKAVTYAYYNGALSSGSHTFKLGSASSTAGIEGLSNEYTFYYNQGNLDYANYIMVAFLVIVLIFAIWIYRKPVKNYGKPKARR